MARADSVDAITCPRLRYVRPLRHAYTPEYNLCGHGCSTSLRELSVKLDLRRSVIWLAWLHSMANYYAVRVQRLMKSCRDRTPRSQILTKVRCHITRLLRDLRRSILLSLLLFVPLLLIQCGNHSSHDRHSPKLPLLDLYLSVRDELEVPLGVCSG